MIQPAHGTSRQLQLGDEELHRVTLGRENIFASAHLLQVWSSPTSGECKLLLLLYNYYYYYYWRG